MLRARVGEALGRMRVMGVNFEDQRIDEHEAALDESEGMMVIESLLSTEAALGSRVAEQCQWHQLDNSSIVGTN